MPSIEKMSKQDLVNYVSRNTDFYSLCFKWSFSPLGKEDKRRTDKLVKHAYPAVYENLFRGIRDQSLNILEIGIETGGSLGLWRDYFYNSQIYGIDIKEKDFEGVSKKSFEEDRISVEILDSTNRKKSKSVFKDVKFHAIIDDGSHILKDQISTFENYYKRLEKGGLYIVEDFESVENMNAFIEYAQSFEVLERTNIKFMFANLTSIRGRLDDLMVIGIQTKDFHVLESCLSQLDEIDHFKYSYLLDLYTLISSEDKRE